MNIIHKPYGMMMIHRLQELKDIPGIHINDEVRIDFQTTPILGPKDGLNISLMIKNMKVNQFSCWRNGPVVRIPC